VNGITAPIRHRTFGNGGRGVDEIVGVHNLNLSVARCPIIL